MIEGKAGAAPTTSATGMLVVDLDHSLVATDLFWESVFRLLKGRPWCLPMLPWWLLRGGRARLKGEVARRVAIRPETLPYNEALLELIRDHKARGCCVILATASPRGWAAPIADHLGLFDAVLATEPGRNLKGAGKLRAIREDCLARGLGGFAYVGDCGADLPIWREAEVAYVVAPGAGLARKLKPLGSRVQAVGSSPGRAAAALRALRPHQWAKNLLIFVPLVTSQRIFEPRTFAAALAAFAAFSLCASAIYLLNDLFDLAADRDHPEKRRRPFASGALPLAWGPPMVFALLAAAFALSAAALTGAFVAVLMAYVALTCAYSIDLKSRLMADVLLLAGLYSIRLFAGGVAAGIPISEWLIGFSMFLFLSLAFVKRFVELDRSILAGNTGPLKGRGYAPSDLSLIETMGPISGYLAVLVLALYIQSEEVQRLYRSPDLLWPVGLCLIYWISRIWFFARRRALPGDPVVFALRDRNSWIVGGIVVACLIAAATLEFPAGSG